MKLGVLTTSYPRWDGDPAGGFVDGHVRALRALGHTVDVVAAGAHEPLFYRGGAPEALERGAWRSWLAAASFTARMTIETVTRDWDAVIAHWLVPSAIAALPSRLPLLAIAHGGDVHLLRRLGLLAPTLALLRARKAQLAFVSKELRDLCGAHDAIARSGFAGPRSNAERCGEWIVQPMGIDVARFAAIPRAPLDPPVVLACGRLVPVKGFDVAIAAMKHVNARLVIAGDGPERDRLRGAELLGPISTTERDAWLSRASVVVVPSRRLANGRSEGTPLIALEALAAGVPVVGSRVGGLADLPIAHVPPDDPRALAGAIDLALGNRWQPPSMAHLDWARVATRLVPRLRNHA